MPIDPPSLPGQGILRRPIVDPFDLRGDQDLTDEQGAGQSEPDRTEHALLCGYVRQLGGDQLPVVGARVDVEGRTCLSRPDGFYQLELSGLDFRVRLHATAHGYFSTSLDLDWTPLYSGGMLMKDIALLPAGEASSGPPALVEEGVTEILPLLEQLPELEKAPRRRPQAGGNVTQLALPAKPSRVSPTVEQLLERMELGNFVPAERLETAEHIAPELAALLEELEEVGHSLLESGSGLFELEQAELDLPVRARQPAAELRLLDASDGRSSGDDDLIELDADHWDALLELDSPGDSEDQVAFPEVEDELLDDEEMLESVEFLELGDDDDGYSSCLSASSPSPFQDGDGHPISDDPPHGRSPHSPHLPTLHAPAVSPANLLPRDPGPTDPIRGKRASDGFHGNQLESGRGSAENREAVFEALGAENRSHELRPFSGDRGPGVERRLVGG